MRTIVSTLFVVALLQTGALAEDVLRGYTIPLIDLDGDVDLVDFARFEAAFHGSGN